MHTSDFTFDKKNRILVSEASSLTKFCAQNIIKITSSSTGQEATFQLKRVLRDHEGKVYGWEYIPTGSGINVTVKIYND